MKVRNRIFCWEFFPSEHRPERKSEVLFHEHHHEINQQYLKLIKYISTRFIIFIITTIYHTMIKSFFYTLFLLLATFVTITKASSEIADTALKAEVAATLEKETVRNNNDIVDDNIIEEEILEEIPENTTTEMIDENKPANNRNLRGKVPNIRKLEGKKGTHIERCTKIDNTMPTPGGQCNVDPGFECISVHEIWPSLDGTCRGKRKCTQLVRCMCIDGVWSCGHDIIQKATYFNQ